MISPTKQAASPKLEEALRPTTILDIPENRAACISSMGLNCFVIKVERGARNSSVRRSIGASPSLVCPSRRSYRLLAVCSSKYAILPYAVVTILSCTEWATVSLFSGTCLSG